jgi:hypothetical protein
MRNKILLVLLVFISLFLFGCLSYNPPKYTCECRVLCNSTYRLIEYVTSIGNNTIETTKASCERAGVAWCGEGNVINYTCNPMPRDEYMKKVGERRR